MSIKLSEDSSSRLSYGRSTSSLTSLSAVSKTPQNIVFVIEIGERYTRIGLAGDYSPREVFRTEYVDPFRPGFSYSVFDQSRPDEEQLRILTGFLKEITTRKLLKCPVGSHVVLVENLLTMSRVRDLCAKSLFENASLNVGGVLFAPSPLMNCIAHNVKTSLVIDIGINECTVTPVVDSIVMVSQTMTSLLSTKAVEQRIRKLMAEHGRVHMTDRSERKLTDDDLTRFDQRRCAEDILFRFCFATTRQRGQRIQKFFADPSNEVDPHPPKVSVPFGTEFLIVPGIVREAAAEVLFEPNEADYTIPELVVECAAKLPMDLRRPLLGGILVVGGSSGLKGFLPRLRDELTSLLKDVPCLRNITHVGFYHDPSMSSVRMYSAWLGGSLFGSLDILGSRVMTRPQWDKSKHVPDWAESKDVDFPFTDQCKITEIDVNLPWSNVPV